MHPRPHGHATDIVGAALQFGQRLLKFIRADSTWNNFGRIQLVFELVLVLAVIHVVVVRRADLFDKRRVRSRKQYSRPVGRRRRDVL